MLRPLKHVRSGGYLTATPSLRPGLGLGFKLGVAVVLGLASGVATEALGALRVFGALEAVAA